MQHYGEPDPINPGSVGGADIAAAEAAPEAEAEGPIQPPGRSGLTWEAAINGLRDVLADQTERAVQAPWQRSRILTAMDLMVANSATLPAPEQGQGRWTEGVCGDGAAILFDGAMVPIEEVVRELNGRPATLPAPEDLAADQAMAANLRDLLIRESGLHSGASSAHDLLQRVAAMLVNYGLPARPAATPAPEPSEDRTEETAKLIYTSMRFAVAEEGRGSCDWVERGNSLMQDEARRTARAILAGPDCLATPPAPDPGEVGELVAWIHKEAIHGPDADEWRRAATLIQQQEAELANLRGVPVAELDDQRREAIHQAVAEALGSGAYDCTRGWGAWQVGTMGEDDFVLVAEDSDRVAEIADAAIEAIRAIPLPAPQSGEVQP